MPRVLEFIVAFFGLIFLLPILIIISIAIVLNTRGSIFYCADRIGKGGKSFTIFKFRTMVKDANKFGPPITTMGDKRITFIGSILRKTKLDELPQLINVLKGNMGLVGPRPEDPEIVKKYSTEQRKILKYKPGITSPASIKFKAEENSIPYTQWQKEYLDNILPDKILMDIHYIQKANFWSDFIVILQTLCLVKRKNQ